MGHIELLDAYNNVVNEWKERTELSYALFMETGILRQARGVAEKMTMTN